MATRQLHPSSHHGPARRGPTRSARIGSWTWADPVVRAWLAVALVPVSALLAFGAVEGVYALLGYQVGVDEAPVWVARGTGLAVVVILLTPCLVAVRYGNRARAGRDPRGWAPLVIGALVGGGWLVAAGVALVLSF